MYAPDVTENQAISLDFQVERKQRRIARVVLTVASSIKQNIELKFILNLKQIKIVLK